MCSEEEMLKKLGDALTNFLLLMLTIVNVQRGRNAKETW
jgi:hypothetical protein